MSRKKLKTAFAAVLVLSAIITVATADDLILREVSTLKLRPQTRVTGRVVTVADVLVTARADPRLMLEIADATVLAPVDAARTVEISHSQVVEALARAGVNMSRVLIGGSLTCRVTIEPPAEPRPPAAATAPPTVNDSSTSPRNAATLAEQLTARLADEFASMGGTPLVDFERGAETFLELTSPPFDFAIRSLGNRRLGLREINVIIRRDGRVQRTVRIRASLRLIKSVIVAARPLNSGAFVRRDDLVTEERIFERIADVGSDDLGLLVGKQLKKFVPASHRLTPADVKSGRAFLSSLDSG